MNKSAHLQCNKSNLAFLPLGQVLYIRNNIHKTIRALLWVSTLYFIQNTNIRWVTLKWDNKHLNSHAYSYSVGVVWHLNTSTYLSHWSTNFHVSLFSNVPVHSIQAGKDIQIFSAVKLCWSAFPPVISFKTAFSQLKYKLYLIWVDSSRNPSFITTIT